MPLSTGTLLGPYEIVAPIGAGGMGEVYKARDTRLGRDVAVKVSAEQFSERFEREARSIAALNHPNICHLYDVGPNYLVMELIDGVPVKGPLPVATALDYTKQIADALDAAHERGIIHRDLKPANILVTAGGAIKVLDFGLAKTADAPASNPENSPTMTISTTRAGMILGTAAYMAPEQARGKAVDKRADIWAFGVVLYEMLTGKQLFEGETVSDILAAVLRAEPNLSDVPEKFRRLLEACLEKDPKKRLRDIADFGRLLDVAPPIRPAERRLNWLPWGVGPVLLFAAALLGFIHFREIPPEAPVLRATILPPEESTFNFYGGLSNVAPPAISPDGRRLVFGVKDKDGKSRLWIRQLDSLLAQPLSGTDNAIHPFWSPDSKSIAFFADGKLKKTDATGAPPLPLSDAPDPRGGTWNRDGVIVFQPHSGVNPLMRIAASGGLATPLPGESGRWPRFLPDGRHYLFLTSGLGGGVYLGSIDSKESKRLVDGITDAAYSQSYILYLREDVLMAQPFDPSKLAFSGEALPLQPGVGSVGASRRGIFSVSENGQLIYGAGGSVMATSQLTWFDRNGRKLGSLGEPANFRLTRISPDGKTVAAEIGNTAIWDIWLFDVARGLKTRFTFSGGETPYWSPGGTSIVFRGAHAGKLGVLRKAANMSGSEEVLTTEVSRPAGWLADGKSILVTEGINDTAKLFVLPVEGEHKLTAAIDSSIGVGGELSPDGHWLASTSREAGEYRLYVAAFPGPGGKVQVSTGAGGGMRWRRDGKELFFASSGKLMSVELSYPNGAIQVGRIQPVAFDIQLTPAGFDVSPDGQRFLVPVTVRETRSEPLTLVQNWTATLKK
jgi:serine/threonine protein kinase